MLAPAVVKLTPANAPVTKIDEGWSISVKSVFAGLLSPVKMFSPIAVLEEIVADESCTNCAVARFSDCAPNWPVNVIGVDTGKASQRLPESGLKPAGGVYAELASMMSPGTVPAIVALKVEG